MRFLKDIENQAISIKKMSIIKAFLVMIVSVLLEAFGQIPIEILKIFSRQFTHVGAYIDFAFGVVVKYFIIILLLKWYSKKSDHKELKEPLRHKQNLNRKNFICIALIIIAFRLIYDNSLLYWVNKIPMPDFIIQAFEEMSMEPITMILSVAIIAPIYEEVIFRGILLKGMSRKMNPKLAIIVSALFFAVLHLNIPQGINAFLLGLVIGAIYLSTGSIYLSIFAHFVNNSVGISISGFFASISGKYSILSHGVAFIVGVIILTAVYRWYKQSETENELPIYREFKEL
ncbi:MAG: lysostaphin resistance A-like protein [Clostridium sp.]|uniref:CPBP family intramembrane glutamic endopeptidase n=1 Tax=Clostridium sp. TaxID=1506 RepID=UPI003D6CCC59